MPGGQTLGSWGGNPGREGDKDSPGRQHVSRIRRHSLRKMVSTRERVKGEGKVNRTSERQTLGGCCGNPTLRSRGEICIIHRGSTSTVCGETY